MNDMIRWTMWWGIVFLLFGAQESFSAYSKDFLWGAAWSAHQTEGSTGGGEAGDWYRFEHPASGAHSPIDGADNADRAVDHWNRYSEDLDQARSLGLNTVRTSLAWEKIEPSPGVFSTEALTHYRAELQSMHEHGLRPMIALQHFTHPQWFNDRGGWTNPDAPRYFLDYATRVVQELGSLCDLWITFNEPMVLVQMGYLKGEVPPLLASLDGAHEAAYQLIRAHRMVASMIHQTGNHGVGLANSFQLYEPANPNSAMDRRAADAVAELSNWAFVRGVLTGHVEFVIPPEVPGVHNFTRDVPSTDTPAWDGQSALDWLGVNYYTRYQIAYNPKSAIRADWITPDGLKSDNGWGIYPEGLEKILRQTAAIFPKIPLVVSENGLSDAEDSRRPAFIHASLASLDHAVNGSFAGLALDIRGYYHWSLMDNFEWLSGYQYRFGLVSIDYQHGLTRTPRASARTFMDEISQRKH